MSCRRIDKPVDVWQGKQIFRTSLIQIHIIYAYSPLLILFQNNNCVRQLFWILDFFNEPILQQLIHFIINNFLSKTTVWSFLLFYQLMIWIYIQLMSGHIRINSYHVSMRPNKTIRFVFEKRYNFQLHFGGQLCLDVYL